MYDHDTTKKMAKDIRNAALLIAVVSLLLGLTISHIFN